MPTPHNIPLTRLILIESQPKEVVAVVVLGLVVDLVVVVVVFIVVVVNVIAVAMIVVTDHIKCSTGAPDGYCSDCVDILAVDDVVLVACKKF